MLGIEVGRNRQHRLVHNHIGRAAPDDNQVGLNLDIHVRLGDVIEDDVPTQCSAR